MLAIIGGTGFGELAGLTEVQVITPGTPFGGAVMQRGKLAGQPAIFLPRHGLPPATPPHMINYRANVQALRDLGVSGIVAVTAVGSVDPDLQVPHLVIPDNIIDYTWGREHTFFTEQIHHIDFTFPYDPALRGKLIEVATSLFGGDLEVPLKTTGVYGCTQGPRLETAAEIHRLRADGCNIVGMTAMPEASLAREAGLPYAGISVVVNKGAGVGGESVDMDGIAAAIDTGMDWVRQIILRLLAVYS